MIAARAGERRRGVGRTTALQPDSDHADPVLRVGGQHRHQFIGIALRVPGMGIGIGPVRLSCWVVVVEEAGLTVIGSSPQPLCEVALFVSPL